VASTATAQERAFALATYLSTKTQLNTAQAGLFSLQSTMFAKWKTYTDIAQSSSYQNSDLSPNTTNRVLTPFTIAHKQQTHLLDKILSEDKEEMVA